MKALVLLLLVACSESMPGAQAFVGESCMCPCACAPDVAADAVLDAPPDARPFDMVTPWVRHPIADIVQCKGADGVDITVHDGRLWVASACEEGAATVVASAPVCTDTWDVTRLPGSGTSSFVGPEDAVFGDANGDGDPLDVVVCMIGKVRMFAHNGSGWLAGVNIASTSQRYLRCRVQEPGVVVTGAYSTGATVTRHTLVGGTWVPSILSTVGQTKELQLDGGEVLVWDYRTSLLGGLFDASSGLHYTGSRYTMGGFRKLGHMLTGTGDASGSTVVLDGVTLPYPSDFGWYRNADIGDINGDGLLDLVLTSSHAGDASTVSARVWLRAPLWDRGEISGPADIKSDNPVLYDVNCDGRLDSIATEENTGGLFWEENPGGL